MPLTKILDETPFTGLAVTFVHTGFNASIEFEPSHWSPHEFGSTPSEAILKCIAKNAPRILPAIESPPLAPLPPLPILAPPPY